MEIVVAILIIALIAAVAFAVIQRRPDGAGGLTRSRRGPVTRQGRVPRDDPMAAAVVEHAEAIDPADVVVAEQRLKAQARQVAAPMQAEANRAEHQRAADQLADGGAYGADPRLDDVGYVEPAPVYGDPRLDDRVDPVTGAPAPGYVDPATDPRYADPAYDGAAPVDPDDPHRNERRRRRI